MSRVIIFSRFFPAYHPRKGEETFFVEKFWNSFREEEFSLPKDFNSMVNDYCRYMPPERYFKGFDTPEEKYHTIRAGNRWKVGDKFSPRVWSGKPYRSKQIIIAPDIEVKKVLDFKIEQWGTVTVSGDVIYDYNYLSDDQFQSTERYYNLCKNDGLHADDFDNWFKSHYKKWSPFSGQIICWNENIKY